MIEQVELNEISSLTGESITPGSLVCHADDSRSRGLVISRTNNQITIVWSVKPDERKRSIRRTVNAFDRLGKAAKKAQWSMEEAQDLLEGGRIRGCTITHDINSRDDVDIKIDFLDDEDDYDGDRIADWYSGDRLVRRAYFRKP